jgi:hypothetical protein
VSTARFVVYLFTKAYLLKMTEEEKLSDRRARRTASNRKWRASHPETWSAAKRRYKLKGYGLTQLQFDDMLSSQNFSCAICGSKEPKGVGNFHVDHCHTTGAVRGLLCHCCNTALGGFKDNPAALRKAATYLEGSYVHVLH